MILNHKDLALQNTMRLTSFAKEYVEVRSRQELVDQVKDALSYSMPFMIVGGGSNVLFLHDFNGRIIKNLYMESSVVRDESDYVELRVSSGYPVAKLIAETTDAGYEGFEYHLGLPGTVGGAIYMNSKWTRPLTYFGDNLVSAHILTKEGFEKDVDKQYFKFAYDYSFLQTSGDILLDAVFRLKKGDRDMLKQRAQEALAYRKKTQPFGVSTSGCIFQNVNGISAGKLIDEAGLKGAREGAFIVSDIHANFIINEGGGTAADLQKLISRIKSTVKQKHSIELKEEVRLL